MNSSLSSSYSPFDTSLLTIDPATGHANSIAKLAVTGISFDPERGILYGISNGALGLSKGLYTIDTGSGSAALVGSLSLDNPTDLQFVAVPEPPAMLLVCIPALTLLLCRSLEMYRHAAVHHV